MYQDHRPLGLGALDRDRYVDSLREPTLLAIDEQGEEIHTLAWSDAGRVVACRTFGTAPDGDVFERVLVSLFLTDADHLLRFEDFELEDAERAVACTASIEREAEVPAGFAVFARRDPHRRAGALLRKERWRSGGGGLFGPPPGCCCVDRFPSAIG